MYVAVMGGVRFRHFSFNRFFRGGLSCCWSRKIMSLQYVGGQSTHTS